MGEPSRLDKTFQIILKYFMETGQAPHYTEIASELDVSMEEGRKALHDLFFAGVEGWLYPKTDFIVSFSPFNNLPTQFRITIDGQQKWFGQWAFESLAVCWLFPGKVVQIDTPCLDCGDPIQVQIRDGVPLKVEPQSLISYVAVPLAEWYQDLSYAWATMTFFRSEAHLHNWAQFDPATEEGIIPLDDLIKLFSGRDIRRRMDPDYFSHMSEYNADFMATLKEIGKTGPFWSIEESWPLVWGICDILGYHRFSKGRYFTDYLNISVSGWCALLFIMWAERIISVQVFQKDESKFWKYQFNFTHHMRHILLRNTIC